MNNSRTGTTGRFMKLAIVASLSILTLLLLPSCGGGTRGSGGTDISGRVLTQESTPVEAATVTVVETADSGVTDSNGTFLVRTKIAGNATLQIERTTLSAQVVLENLPEQNARVTVEIEVNEESNSADVKGVAIEITEEDEDDDHGGDVDDEDFEEEDDQDFEEDEEDFEDEEDELDEGDEEDDGGEEIDEEGEDSGDPDDIDNGDNDGIDEETEDPDGGDEEDGSDDHEEDGDDGEEGGDDGGEEE